VKRSHEAKFGLYPRVELAKNTGIPEHKLNEIKKITDKHADKFRRTIPPTHQ